MRDLSLHVLDLAQNSVVAGARRIGVYTHVDTASDTLRLTIEDDGHGMSAAFVADALSPFTTTRTTRKVGLGLPMMLERSRAAGGDLAIQSELGKGTTVTSTMRLSHIDRPPLGDIAGTLYSLIMMAEPGLDYVVRFSGLGESFELDMSVVRAQLDGIPIADPGVSMWIRDALAEAAQPYLDIDRTSAGGLTIDKEDT